MSDNDIAARAPARRILDQIRGEALRRGSAPATAALPTPVSQPVDTRFGAPRDQMLQNVRRGALDRAPR